jgi:predicted DNA-binding transcriptional regulator YafY
VLEQNPGSMLQNIQANVRVVSDGIGRQNAVIDPAILRVVFEAIGSREALKLHYVSSRREESDKELNPLGLVAKDGTIYLLATRGLETRPKHYALHRARAAERIARPRSVPRGFDLDQYIEDSHKLSHVLDAHEGLVELQLRVAPETMYHFRERLLSKNQQIDEHNRDERGWFLVTNTIPVTIQLVPFLLSHGGWIEVVGPESVRQEMKRRLKTAAAHYGK